MALKNDAIDVKVIAHISGLDLVSQCLRDLNEAAKKMGEAIEALSVELEVD